MTFTIPNSASFAEANDCHDPATGEFCSTPGAAKPRKIQTAGKGTGFTLYFSTQEGTRTTHQRFYNFETDRDLDLNATELKKVNNAKIRLEPSSLYTAKMGTPRKWMAPNGVLVVYTRSILNSFHDFNPGDEHALAATRNVGPGRRALRAWAKEFLVDTTTERFKARRLVRSDE